MTDEWRERYDEKQHTDEREHERLDNVRVQERQDSVDYLKQNRIKKLVTTESLNAIFAQIERQNAIKRQEALNAWVRAYERKIGAK